MASAAAAHTRNGQHRGFQGWRRRKPRDLEDLLLVEGLPQQQGFDKRIELLAVCAQETPRFVVALADDLEHLGIDGFSSRLAERSRARVTVRAAEIGVLPGRELH